MSLNPVLAGAIACATLVVAVFFLRFWRSSGDRFFLFFAISFALESANRVALALSADSNEERPAFYLVRLVSYVLILVAIADKNRRPPPAP
jgi:hypothetical protein